MNKVRPNTGHTDRVFEQRLELILEPIKKDGPVEIRVYKEPKNDFRRFVVTRPNEGGQLELRIYRHSTVAKIADSSGVFMHIRRQIHHLLACPLP